MLTIRVMEGRGDREHTFDVKEADAVAEAKALFERLQEVGYNAYRTQPNGQGGGIQEKFDAEQDVVMVPNLHLG